MADTMIERVARTLRDEIASPSGDGEWVLDEGFRSAEYFADIARTIVAAMREQTDMMGNGLSTMPRQPYKPGSHSAAEIWRAMIDAAIEEAS